jgi:hypothetical protein
MPDTKTIKIGCVQITERSPTRMFLCLLSTSFQIRTMRKDYAKPFMLIFSLFAYRFPKNIFYNIQRFLF